METKQFQASKTEHQLPPMIMRQFLWLLSQEYLTAETVPVLLEI